jgi:hypothetical protein
VRELQNLVERLAVLKGTGEIGVADLPPPMRAAATSVPSPQAAPTLPPEGIDLYAALAELEDRLINEALENLALALRSLALAFWFGCGLATLLATSAVFARAPDRKLAGDLSGAILSRTGAGLALAG